MKRTWLKTILTVLCLLLILYSGVNLAGILLEYRQADTVYDTAQTEFLQAPAEEDQGELAEDAVTWPTFTIDFARLQSVNEEVYAWIWMHDTVVNYPVVRSGTDNDAYLEVTYDGTYNSSGSIFMDYRNAADFSDVNTVLYGHNMRSGKMFAVLKRFSNQAFYEKHREFYILTPEGNRRYEIIAAFQTDAQSDVYDRGLTDEAARAAWLDNVLRSSYILTQPEAGAADSFVTLSTCVSGNDDRARFVVIGRLAEIGPPYGGG